MADIEIKSSLLNDSIFDNTRNSLIAVSEQDRKENWRVKTIEYINQKASSEGDEVFYNLLPHVLFLYDDGQTTAYTDEYKLIYFNAPGIIGDNIRHWDFTFAHECLHQLWDTFKVADKIKETPGLEYNHTCLNIASDCVINDYLIAIRKKSCPDGLVTPELLKKQFGIDFDRTKETQFDLYVKLLNKIKEDKKNEDTLKKMDNFSGKLKPAKVTTVDADDNTPPPGPSMKHSQDYIDGWTQAIKDVLDKKIDPMDWWANSKQNPVVSSKQNPVVSEAKNNAEYDQGYSDAMNQIIEGLKSGITMSPSKGGGQSGDLPQIPWDLPPMDNKSNDNKSGGKGNSDDSDSNESDSDAQDSASDAQNSASDASDAANKAQESADKAKQNNDPDAAKKQKAADKAKKAADKAKDEARKAREAANKGDEKKAKEAAENAADAAADAKAAAVEAGANKDDLHNSVGNTPSSEAQAHANNAKEYSKIAKNAADAAARMKDKDASKKADAAKKAQEAADKAQKAADEAKKAELAGDKEKAKKAVEDAKKAENDAQNEAAQAGYKPLGNDDKPFTNNQTNAKVGAGSGHCPIQITEAEKQKYRKHGQDVIDKAVKSIGGPYGDFLKTCTAAAKLKPNGLEVRAKHAAKGWNENLETAVIAYVKERVNQFKRKFKRSYRRLRRGTGEVKPGEILRPGKVVIDEQMIINVAFYIDRSGSMITGDRIEHVWKATYVICDSLKQMFAREKCVEDIEFKLIAFDTGFDEIKFGNRCNAGGGTCRFSDLLAYMNEHTKEYLVTIVISDGEFSELTVNDIPMIEKELKKYDGMVYTIFSDEQQIIKKVQKKHPNTLYYYKASSNFELT